jgi:hypothetical protein
MFPLECQGQEPAGVDERITFASCRMKIITFSVQQRLAVLEDQIARVRDSTYSMHHVGHLVLDAGLDEATMLGCGWGECRRAMTSPPWKNAGGSLRSLAVRASSTRITLER